jgi:DNA-binding CsgD family transcriptional regulator
MSDSARGASGLERAREHYARREWARALDEYRKLDAAGELPPEDLPQLGHAATLAGDDAAYYSAFERSYQAELDANHPCGAARAAFWLGFHHMTSGEFGHANAWFGRSQRLVDTVPGECAERGYLLLPQAFRQVMSGDLEAGAATAQQAVDIGLRVGARDVVALGQNLIGRVLLRQGRTEAGFGLMDESMLAVTRGELSPFMIGVLYCGVIATCHKVFALERAREWTTALTAWCQAQPELVPFRGQCQVHRAEVMQWAGAWKEALEQAECAVARGERESIADAWYQKGEIHRLRGESAEAEQAYQSASQRGREPQPGLGLLRATQGQLATADRTLRRLLGETSDPLTRSQYLPAAIEVWLGLGALDDAASACDELQRTAERFDTAMLSALAASARGQVLLASGDPQAALGPLRRACFLWQRLNTPYFEARVRVALGRACQLLGDEEGARLLLDAAKATFQDLGAAVDLASLGSAASAHESEAARPFGLTARELEVLRLLATGKTNKEIAQVLCLSEKTIDRHVSNLFAKLDVSTRSAATALAYEQHLL